MYDERSHLSHLYFKGIIDDLRIYNRKLSDSEVREVYQLEKPIIDLIDTDSDGLTDSDETNIHKTNPNNPDTDSDGLNDGVEVNKNNTNPLVVDTDGDG